MLGDLGRPIATMRFVQRVQREEEGTIYVCNER